MFAKTFLASIAIMLIDFSHAEYDVAKYCNLIQPGTKLASKDSCSTYYTCEEYGEPTKGVCKAGTLFSRNNQGCVPESDSDCIQSFSNPCADGNKQFVASAKGSNWYNYCSNGVVVAEGTCPLGEIFNPANGSCINNNGACDISDEGGVQNLCDIMPAGQYFGDFKDCSAWYQCVGSNLEKGNCLGSLVFNVKTTQCLKNDGNMCQRTDNIVKSQASGPPKEPCTSPNQIAADLNVCSIYYTCKRSPNNPNIVYDWIPRTCPNNQYFDVISKMCTSTTVARSYPGCDRCKFTTGSPYWANAVDPSCRSYFICKNGQKTTLGSCSSDSFYSESQQACIQGTYTLRGYENDHGACQDYKCTEDRVCFLSGNEPPTDKTTTTTTTTTKKPEQNSE